MNATPSSSSNFQSIFNTALNAYEKRTKKDLLAHPLASQLQKCDSPDSILALLQGQVDDLDQAQKCDERLTKWLGPAVNVLLAFSDTIGEGVSLVFSPSKVIFAGAGVLLQAAKDVVAAQEALVDIFERIENFFRRMVTYTEVRPTEAMTDIIVKIMVEVLNILAIATKEIKQGRTKKYLKKLMGKTDIEDALRRLDKLTQEEVRMATAQLLKITEGVDDKVKDVGDRVNLVLGDGRETKAMMQQMAREATASMQVMASNIGEVKRNQWRQDLRRWFSSPDPSTNHVILCGAQHEGTTKWFFQGSLLEEWKSTGSLLWIHGKPGSGKSVLCSAVVQDIMTLRDAGSALMAYFYFDFRDTEKQNRRNMILSLLSQLFARSDICCDILYRAYQTHNNGAHQPIDDVLIQYLKETLSFSNDGPIYIILDALDECPNTFGIPSPRDLVLGLVKELIELSLPHLHICVTSRPEIDIRTALESLTTRRVSLHEETGQKKDIVDYVSSAVHTDTNMGKWREQDQNLIIETLSDKADGMFRWVFCQLETLRHCFPPSLRRILQELPKSLDETYERVLKNINQASRAYAHRLLQCLTVAARPLRLSELAEVLAFDFDEVAPGGIPKLNSDWRREDQERAVLSTCSSLITVVHNGESRVVQFSHFSVKEFLTSDRLAAAVGDISFHHVDLEPAHTILAQACLGVLLRLDDCPREASVERFPLAEYAAEHWVDHALYGCVSSRINDAMESLFDLEKPHFSRWIQIHDVDDDEWGLADGETRPERLDAAPVYYAALCGLRDMVEKLIDEHPNHLSIRGGTCGMALHAASRRNHLNIVQSLLKHGADVNAKGQWGRTPLHIASRWGHVEIGRCLLERGANVNTKQDNDQWTPLHDAASSGHFEVIQMLLKHNADINAQEESGYIPLHWASNNGEVDIARLLLDNGADPRARGKNQWTPLHSASYVGRIEVAQLLLEHGVDVDAVEDIGRSAYQIALDNGHDEVAQLLLGQSVENKT